MATYSIQVLNSSGLAKSYVVFMQPPRVVAAGDDPVVHSNAWVVFTSILPGGADTIAYPGSTFAYWATAMMPIVPGTTMGDHGVAAVSSENQDSVRFIGKPPAGFGPVSPGGAMTGAFKIIASSDFDPSSGYVLGLAAPGNVAGILSPVATFVAGPNHVYDIFPHLDFYVAEGVYAPGAIIDFSAAASHAGKVIFTGKNKTHAVVTQRSDGLFTTQYY